MRKTIFAIFAGATLTLSAPAQNVAAHFTMDAAEGSVTESVSGQRYAVASALPLVSVAAPDGQALRFDGYSNYIRAAIPADLSGKTLTVSMTLAAETYPMMSAEAEDVPTYARLCGNLDEAAATGFALELSSKGALRFRFATTAKRGGIVVVDSREKFVCGKWSTVAAVVDCRRGRATLCMNGREVGSAAFGRTALAPSAAPFLIGKDATEQLREGRFLTNTFCGLIDDIAVSRDAPASWSACASAPRDIRPDFRYPAERYAASLWRPLFHGMPSGGWTNESHGLAYSGGRWHVFFQKNANGPYMSRLHWGHISSPDLCRWREEPIALAPSEPYDIKGCWSGCVYDDGKGQHAVYTAVTNSRAVLAEATADDEALASWTKRGIIVDGCPEGMSDDFRDPYHFTVGGQEYLLAGSSKDSIGCCTLHRKTAEGYTRDGSLFFRGTSRSEHGRFWEMSNVTPMPGGRWLFTTTPLETDCGVRTLCWVGTIGEDGTFKPDRAEAQTLEMNGISRDGFGLLSPSLSTRGDTTLLLGIVPDKLPGSDNYRMGWAHNYSLPREISIDAAGNICQRPYTGLKSLRTATTVSWSACASAPRDFVRQTPHAPRDAGKDSCPPWSGGASAPPTLPSSWSGGAPAPPTLPLVQGRHIELLGDFTVGDAPFGFRFLKSGGHGATLSYEPSTNRLTLDLTRLPRRENDRRTYSGIYSATLPEAPAKGERLRLHVFLDGSIADIFVAGRWAFSVRLFPTEEAGVEAETFTAKPAECAVKAWVLAAE